MNLKLFISTCWTRFFTPLMEHVLLTTRISEDWAEQLAPKNVRKVNLKMQLDRRFTVTLRTLQYVELWTVSFLSDC